MKLGLALLLTLSSFSAFAQSQMVQPTCPPGMTLVSYPVVSNEEEGKLDGEPKVAYVCEAMQQVDNTLEQPTQVQRDMYPSGQNFPHPHR